MDQEQEKHTWERLESQLLDELQMFLSNTGSYSAQNYFQKYTQHWREEQILCLINTFTLKSFFFFFFPPMFGNFERIEKVTANRN